MVVSAMAQLVRRDTDTILVGIILIIAAAVGQFLAFLVRGNRYFNGISPGTILFPSYLALIAGLILIVIGAFRLIRRFESRLLSN